MQLVDLPIDTILYLLDFTNPIKDYRNRNSPYNPKEIFGYFTKDNSRQIHLLFNHWDFSKFNTYCIHSKIPRYIKIRHIDASILAMQRWSLTPEHYISLKCVNRNSFNQFDYLKGLTSIGNWKIEIKLDSVLSESWMKILEEWQNNRNVSLTFLVENHPQLVMCSWAEKDQLIFVHGKEADVMITQATDCLNTSVSIAPKASVVLNIENTHYEFSKETLQNIGVAGLIIDLTREQSEMLKMLDYPKQFKDLRKLEFVFRGRSPLKNIIKDFHATLNNSLFATQKLETLEISIYDCDDMDNRLKRRDFENLLPKLIRVFKPKRFVIDSNRVFELSNKFVEECEKCEKLKLIESIGTYDPYNWKTAKLKLADKLSMVSVEDGLFD